MNASPAHSRLSGEVTPPPTMWMAPPAARMAAIALSPTVSTYLRRYPISQIE